MSIASNFTVEENAFLTFTVHNNRGYMATKQNNSRLTSDANFPIKYVFACLDKTCLG